MVRQPRELVDGRLAHDLLMEAHVLQRDGALAGEVAEQLLLLGGERAAGAGHGHGSERPDRMRDRPSRLEPDQRARPVLGELHRAGEVGVGGVGPDEHVAVRGDAPARRAEGVERGVQDEREQRLAVQRGGERRADAADGALQPRALVLELVQPRDRALDAPAAVAREDGEQHQERGGHERRGVVALGGDRDEEADGGEQRVDRVHRPHDAQLQAGTDRPPGPLARGRGEHVHHRLGGEGGEEDGPVPRARRRAPRQREHRDGRHGVPRVRGRHQHALGVRPPPCHRDERPGPGQGVEGPARRLEQRPPADQHRYG